VYTLEKLKVDRWMYEVFSGFWHVSVDGTTLLINYACMRGFYAYE